MAAKAGFPLAAWLFLAAVTVISVLAHTIWQQLTGHSDINAYATAGLLGIVLFTLAAAASFVATSMQQSEDLVRQKDLDLANLAGAEHPSLFVQDRELAAE